MLKSLAIQRCSIRKHLDSTTEATNLTWNYNLGRMQKLTKTIYSLPEDQTMDQKIRPGESSLYQKLKSRECVLNFRHSMKMR